MIPALVHRGFGHGSGVISPDGAVFILNIPKNASSYVLDWATQQGWRTALASRTTGVKEMVILLRDPVSRWISGIAQYINTYILSVHGPNGPIFPGEAITELDYVMDAETFVLQYTDVTERLIFDVLSRFDDHVWPQHEIIQDILPDVPRRYFVVDHTLDQELSSHFGWAIMPGLDRNAGGDNRNIRDLQIFFRQRLQQRPELQQRLERHYHEDFELLKKTST
jgi:hypothetical protein